MKPQKFFKRFKKEESKSTPLKFPHISRLFPAVSLKLIVTFILSLLLLAVVARESVIMYKQFKVLQTAQEKREKMLSDVTYWKGVVAKRKDYRDGYFQLAVLEYQLEEKEKANQYLQKTLELDPNFAEGRRLEEVIRNKQ